MSSLQTLEPEVQEAVPAETCPRCHTISDWGENSWCPDCGYYPIVDRGNVEGGSWADRLPETPVEEVDDRSAIESIPVWFWVMTVGIIVIAVGSVGLRIALAEQDVLRGRVALGQLGVGLVSIAIAHTIAAKFAMAGDRRISIPDIFLSWFNIWQPTIAKLPATSRRLLALVWGMIACLTAVTIIGGIDYGYPFRDSTGADVKPMDVVDAVASAARAQAAKNGQEEKTLEEAVQGGDGAVVGNNGDEALSMEDAIEQLGDVDEELMQQMDGLTDDSLVQQAESDLELVQYLNSLPADENGIRTVQAFVYGVVTDERNVPTGLLFAINFKGQWGHLTQVDPSGIPGRTFQRIIQKLNGKVTQSTFVPMAEVPQSQPGTRQTWVQPHVLCGLGFTKARNNMLADAHVQAILINQPGVNSRQ